MILKLYLVNRSASGMAKSAVFRGVDSKDAMLRNKSVNSSKDARCEIRELTATINDRNTSVNSGLKTDEKSLFSISG